MIEGRIPSLIDHLGRPTNSVLVRSSRLGRGVPDREKTQMTIYDDRNFDLPRSQLAWRLFGDKAECMPVRSYRHDLSKAITSINRLGASCIGVATHCVSRIVTLMNGRLACWLVSSQNVTALG